MRSVMRCIARPFCASRDRHSTVNGRIFSTGIRWTRALPKRLEEAGFAFRWYDLERRWRMSFADVVYSKHPPVNSGVTGLVALRDKIVW